MTVGEAIDQIEITTRLKRAEIAEKTGYSRQHLNRIKNEENAVVIGKLKDVFPESFQNVTIDSAGMIPATEYISFLKGQLAFMQEHIVKEMNLLQTKATTQLAKLENIDVSLESAAKNSAGNISAPPPSKRVDKGSEKAPVKKHVGDGLSWNKGEQGGR